MNVKKYEAQARHLKEKYTQFKLNLTPEKLTAFKSACYAAGTTPTTEIKRFIDAYLATSTAE